MKVVKNAIVFEYKDLEEMLNVNIVSRVCNLILELDNTNILHSDRVIDFSALLKGRLYGMPFVIEAQEE